MGMFQALLPSVSGPMGPDEPLLTMTPIRGWSCRSTCTKASPRLKAEGVSEAGVITAPAEAAGISEAGPAAVLAKAGPSSGAAAEAVLEPQGDATPKAKATSKPPTRATLVEAKAAFKPKAEAALEEGEADPETVAKVVPEWSPEVVPKTVMKTALDKALAVAEETEAASNLTPAANLVDVESCPRLVAKAFSRSKASAPVEATAPRCRLK